MRPSLVPDAPLTALVLSGGGARGAYEAGVLSGIIEVLSARGLDRAPFDILSGTSVGALNAAYLAAHADQPDMNIAGLLHQWRSLDLSTHLRLDLRGILGWKRGWTADVEQQHERPKHIGRSLLASGAIDDLIMRRIPWDRLHDNIRKGSVRALVVAALHIRTGRTTVFTELAPHVEFQGHSDPRRVLRRAEINADHVLASAAIPLLFPARRVGDDYYCDGGLRFNTPIAPAIRCGADRLVVISLLSDNDVASMVPLANRQEAYQNPIFIIGKVLHALLLDPLRYDLQVLERFNRMLSILEDVLDPADMARVRDVIQESRGLPYRRLSTLVFRPSQDIGHMARERARSLQASRFSSWLLARTATLGTLWESDLVSFILFDAEFAEQLIDLGRKDTLARADEIALFFGCQAIAPLQ